MATSIFQQQLAKFKAAPGFVAALDQSGGSTPKALGIYGIDQTAYSDDAQMYDLIHAMRCRIMTNPEFGGDRIIGAILFENTLRRTVEGLPTSQYLWSKKAIAPFLKVDKGLADEVDGVRLMQPIPGLDELLEQATALDVFGTKMRSVISLANPGGIAALLDQQFEIAQTILGHGLIPIIEPEVDINSPQKGECEAILQRELLSRVENLSSAHPVIFKLTLPDTPDLYGELVGHSDVLRVVALSGGYSRAVACQKLSENTGVIASFSRALTEGLNVQQDDAEFTRTLGQSIEAIYQASASNPA